MIVMCVCTCVCVCVCMLWFVGFMMNTFFTFLTSPKPRCVHWGLTGSVFFPFVLAYKVMLPIIIGHILGCKFDLFRGEMGVEKEEEDRSGRKCDALYNGIIQKNPFFFSYYLYDYLGMKMTFT